MVIVLCILYKNYYKINFGAVPANNTILNNLTMPTLTFILLYNSMARSQGPCGSAV